MRVIYSSTWQWYTLLDIALFVCYTQRNYVEFRLRVTLTEGGVCM